MSEAFQDTGNGRQWGAIMMAIVAFIGAIVIAAIIYSSNATGAKRDDAVERQRHSYEVMILARELDATLAGAEATLGRLVISGDTPVGQLYADQWRRAGTLIARLSQLASPAVQKTLPMLREAYRARGEELGAVALRTTYKQNDQALSKYYSAGKSETLRRLRSSVEQMIAAERANLEARTALATQTAARADAYVLILSIAGVLLALIAAALALTAWIGRVRQRDEALRSLDLEAAVEARTAELERANALLVDEMNTREHAEARLRQAQKMEAIGQLTGGIAHDFNNMLGVVVGGLELAQRRLEHGTDGVARHLDRAMEGATRAAALTKRLLAFARAEPLLPTAIDVNTLIASMVVLLDRTLGDGITVKIAGGARWPVFVDSHQFENVLLNLAVNARDAMANGGNLVINTEDATVHAGEITHLAAGDYVRVTISDSGAGMTPDVLERVFEPFFTTKAPGKGTGLGLSQAFGFVRQSGGSIAIASIPGRGTDVTLYLPRHAAAVQAELATQSREADTAHRYQGCPALVIEDDLRVLAATCEALRELGYEPLPCSGAAEVPPVLRARRDIGVIVSDVLMPGVTGPQLVEAIRVVHPQVPVLFVTGFAGDIEDAAQFGGHEVLRKPFTLASLSAALDRARSAQPEQQAQAQAA